MPNIEILDAPDPQPEKTPPTLRFQKTFLLLEAMLVALALVARLFKLQSWELGNESATVVFSVLGLFYLLGAAFIFGSVGGRRHLGAHVCGLAIAYGVWAELFKIEGWKGAEELAVVGSLFSFQLAFVVFFLAIFRREESFKKSIFFWQILIRLLIIGLVNFWALKPLIFNGN